MIPLLVSVALAQSPPATWARVDVGSVVVMRPVGGAFGFGFDNAFDPVDGVPPFREAFLAALNGREQAYDFALVFLSEGLPNQISDALAFNQTFNRELEGMGTRQFTTEGVPVRGALYMNRASRWDEFPPAIDRWIFNHELGHFWLAYPFVDLGAGREDALLGRQLAHWSYFVHTGGSPMEGNAWIDNGDGSFTTDPTVSGDFSDLDLYLMGMLPAEQVAPFFVIDPIESFGRGPASNPDHFALEPESTTILGDRIDVTVSDIIASEGPVSPGPGEAPTSFRLLTLVVAGPEEVLSERNVQRIRALQSEFVTYWSEGTRQLSSVSFELADEGLSMPPLAGPTWIPGGAR